MGYKIKIIEKNCPTCGFPSKSLTKIESVLENKVINYLVLDRRNNYDPEEISDNKNLNTYEEEFEKAYKYLSSKKRIDEIYKKLLDQINKKDLEEISQEIIAGMEIIPVKYFDEVIKAAFVN